MNELLTIKGLTVKFHTYDGIVHALENVDLDIQEKETFGLLGETGCGKTLTALSILKLIPAPGRIESGHIHLHIGDDGEPVELLTLSEEKMRRIRGKQLAMIFQEPSAALNPLFTIGDHISEVILLHRQTELAEKVLQTLNHLAVTRKGIRLLSKPLLVIERNLYQQLYQNPRSLSIRIIKRIPLVRRILWRLADEADKMTVNLLKEVEIPDAERIARQYPHQLSGGMKQRAVIAAALACSPRFLIADEPTTALDVTTQSQILELLNRLKVEREASILYITHDLAVAAELCDRVGVMYSGRFCEIAEVNEIYHNPLHPYTRALMAAIPRAGEDPKPIGGTIPDPTNPPSGCRFHPRCPDAKPVCQVNVPEMREFAPKHFIACNNYQE